MTKAKVTSFIKRKGGIEKLQARVGEIARSGRVKVGIPTGTKSQEGTPLSLIGSAHEFGIGVPERPFLRNTVRAKKVDYVRLNRINIVRILHGDLTPQQALDQLGRMAVGHVQNFINTNSYTLAASTIRRKGSSQALVDTGGMKGAMSHEVTA